jgi:hypothetical protein
MTKRFNRWLTVLAAGVLTASALGQARDTQDRGLSRQRSSGGSGSGSGPAITPTPPSDQRVPLPGDRPPPQRAAPDDRPTGRPPESTGPRDTSPRDDHRDDRTRPRYPRRPYGYYDYWVYDRNRYYDDGYRGYEPPPPADRGYDRAADGDAPADDAKGPGAALPPEDLMGDDEEQPAELRKALEASPEYREATAELLRAWAEYTRAAEVVIGRLRPTPRYQRAQAALRDAEAKVARVRDRGAPEVNLVTAAQQAMLARRGVRNLEEKAIDADSTARRAKQRVDDAVERRNKVREEIKQKLAGATG